MICEKCKKEMNTKLPDESDLALARYTVKLKKELKDIKNGKSN